MLINSHLPSRRGDEDEEYEEESEEVQSPEQSLSEHDDQSATFAYKKVSFWCVFNNDCNVFCSFIFCGVL